jgi:hypothetical protein
MRIFRRSRWIVVIGAVAAVAAGVSYAAVPGGNGVISGCYDKQSGQLRVTDTQTNQPKGCSAKEAALDWNQRGPQGPQGPEGPPGPADASAQAFVGRFGVNTGNATAAYGVPCTLGQIMLTAGSRTAGGIPANGQLLPIAQNTALFALLGTTYGGNGVTTFAVPDLRAITPSSMTYSICTQGDWPA